MMRKCFLHVGTHKTGTCSIQNTLHIHRDDLAKHGFLYPRTGAVPGHHNIAWEIAGIALFKQQYGTIDELITEIRQSEHDVVLSSEDFILAFPFQAALRAFIERLKQSKLQIIVLVYFRDPPDYFRSAYFEILKAECPVGFAQFIAAMTEKKAIRWGSHYAGGIDVIDHLQQLATDKDIRVIARSYDRVKNSVVVDFLSVIGLTPGNLGIETERRDNQRMMIGDAVSLFYRNRTGRPPNEYEAWLISCLADALDGNDIHMSDGARRRLLASYEYQNQFLRQYGGGAPPEPGESSTELDTGPCLEDIFSETAVRFIERTALKLATEFQIFKSVQPVEPNSEVTQSHIALPRRLWHQITPYLPPPLVGLARSFYHRKGRPG